MSQQFSVPPPPPPRVCANPANPVFNHVLFESIAASVKFGVESNNVAVEDMERALNPTLEKILTQYISPFVPYVFQIMAQFLRLRPRWV